MPPVLCRGHFLLKAFTRFGYRIQIHFALAHILYPPTLQRIVNKHFMAITYSVTDVMGDLTKAIFEADIKSNVNVYRQHLQTSFVEITAGIADPKNATIDDVTKAAALNILKKIKVMLSTAVSFNKETKAHRANLQFIIRNALKVK